MTNTSFAASRHPHQRCREGHGCRRFCRDINPARSCSYLNINGTAKPGGYFGNQQNRLAIANIASDAPELLRMICAFRSRPEYGGYFHGDARLHQAYKWRDVAIPFAHPSGFAAPRQILRQICMEVITVAMITVAKRLLQRHLSWPFLADTEEICIGHQQRSGVIATSLRLLHSPQARSNI